MAGVVIIDVDVVMATSAGVVIVVDVIDVVATRTGVVVIVVDVSDVVATRTGVVVVIDVIDVGGTRTVVIDIIGLIVVRGNCDAGATGIVGVFGLVAGAADVVGDTRRRQCSPTGRCRLGRCWTERCRPTKLSAGTLLDGVLVDGILAGVVVAGVVTAGMGDGVGAATVMQAGSAACSASSQLPRTSPGTPLSSGVPASRDAAIAGTARVSVAQPVMIQMRCRFMGGSSCLGDATIKPAHAGTPPVDVGTTTNVTPSTSVVGADW